MENRKSNRKEVIQKLWILGVEVSIQSVERKINQYMYH